MPRTHVHEVGHFVTPGAWCLVAYMGLGATFTCHEMAATFVLYGINIFKLLILRGVWQVNNSRAEEAL